MRYQVFGLLLLVAVFSIQLSFSQSRKVSRGEITLLDTKKIDAQGIAITSDSVHYFLVGIPRRHSLGLGAVKEIREHRGTYANTGAWIGGIAGAGLGVALALGIQEEKTEQKGSLMVTTTTIQTWPIYVGVFVGALTGGLIGQRSVDWSTVYTMQGGLISQLQWRVNPVTGGHQLSYVVIL